MANEISAVVIQYVFFESRYTLRVFSSATRFDNVSSAILRSCDHSAVVTIKSHLQILAITYIVTITFFAVKYVGEEHKKKRLFHQALSVPPDSDMNRSTTVAGHPAFSGTCLPIPLDEPLEIFPVL